MKNTTLLLLILLPVAGFCQTTDTLKPKSRTLKEVTVTGHVLPVERKRDKVIVNVEASVTNTGSTVLEVLERSPGVTVDRNGGISLNGNVENTLNWAPRLGATYQITQKTGLRAGFGREHPCRRGVALGERDRREAKRRRGVVGGSECALECALGRGR